LKGPLLVTGAAGFIGARFVEAARERGLEVISVDSKEHFGSRPEHIGVDFGTIVDRDELVSRLQAMPEPAAIVHLGACTDTTELDVAYLRRVNLDYSKMLWVYATQHKVPLVYASSAATYGGGELGFDDDETLFSKLKPLNPYGDSKLMFDLWALEQEKAGKRPPAWSGFKFFNVYGYGERHKEKMASVVLHAYDRILKTGEALLFKSHREGIADGHQKRDFVAVEDVVDVLFFALEKPMSRGIFNLGSGQARTFLDLVNAVFAGLKREPKIAFVDTPVEIRDRYQYFTEAKMSRLRAAGYTQPFSTLEEGVGRYIMRLTTS